jgi:hypothetical protein
MIAAIRKSAGALIATAESMKPKRILLAAGCLAVVAGCAWWVWRTQFNQPKFNVALHIGLGRTLAEETARALSHTGKVVLITLPAGAFPELEVQMREFKKVLAQHPGLAIKETYELETDDKRKFNFGSGLSGRRYVRLVNKNMSASGFVSFVGAPELSDKELAELKKVPVLIAESRSAGKLKQLFAQKAVQTAIVGRFEYPTPVKGTPTTPQAWVEQRFQIVRSESAANLPSDGGE